MAKIYARSEDHLQTLLGKNKNRPVMVCYHSDCVSSSRLLREIRQIEHQSAFRDVTLIMIGSDRLSSNYIKRRGITRIPSVAYFNGVFEVERLTGFSTQESLLRGVGRLQDRVVAESALA